MHQVVQYSRLITGLLVVISFAQIGGSNLPPHARLPQNNQRHSREVEAEVAHWSAQLRSSDEEARREAAINLSRLDSNAATSALVSALNDASPAVRALVVAGLGERSDRSVVPLVAARLASDKDPFVRKTAAYALGHFSGTERTAALLAALNDKDPEVRGVATVSLADHAHAVAVAPLATALSDKSAFVRAQAARALGVNGRAATLAVSNLIKLLASDPDGEVKRQAATALGLIGDRSAIPALQRASRDSDSYLAQAARDSMRMLEGTR